MNTPGGKKLSLLIKEKAYDVGFGLCGIAPSSTLKDHGQSLRKWCEEGMNSNMSYLCRDIEKRSNPELLFPGAKSVIVTGLNYFSDKNQGGQDLPVISKYSYGDDYHDVIIEKLNIILKYIKTIAENADGKSFVDTAPILEKAWAQKAGLGWAGKHSVLINDKIGSFFFLGVIILNISLDYDTPFTKDYCGSCRICMDACPTGAINSNRTIDTGKCISYLTVESKAPVPKDIVPMLNSRVYGCDICQDVCPWNNKAKPHKTPEFNINKEIAEFTADDWKGLSEEQFNKLFRKSPIKRRGYNLFKHTIDQVIG